jgi:hypothetical protein
MATVDTKKAYNNMLGKGFKESKNKSKDHKRIEFWYDGKLTRSKTKFSHGKREIDDSLISIMAKQINLTKKEFIQFAECTISESEYIALMGDKNLL